MCLAVVIQGLLTDKEFRLWLWPVWTMLNGLHSQMALIRRPRPTLHSHQTDTQMYWSRFRFSILLKDISSRYKTEVENSLNPAACNQHVNAAGGVGCFTKHVCKEADSCYLRPYWLNWCYIRVVLYWRPLMIEEEHLTQLNKVQYMWNMKYGQPKPGAIKKKYDRLVGMVIAFVFCSMKTKKSGDWWLSNFFTLIPPTT